MKVKHCLVGVAVLAMPAQVEAWLLFSNMFSWITQIFSPPKPAPTPTPTPTPAPTPKPTKSKTILMRINVVPTWEELAPPGAVKIKLGRVVDYWNGLLGSDIKTYQSLFTTVSQQDAAKTAIVTYYTEATKCLNEHSLTTPNSREVFEALIATVRVCVSKSMIPTFVVEETNMVTPAMSTYVPANHLDPDEYAPPPTLAPTPTPTTRTPTVTSNDPTSLDIVQLEPWVFDSPDTNGVNIEPPL